MHPVSRAYDGLTWSSGGRVSGTLVLWLTCAATVTPHLLPRLALLARLRLRQWLRRLVLLV
jgi:hypothetical protein